MKIVGAGLALFITWTERRKLRATIFAAGVQNRLQTARTEKMSEKWTTEALSIAVAVVLGYGIWSFLGTQWTWKGRR